MHDIKEKSAPQEYAFLFISIFNIFLFVIIMGLINIAIGINLFNGGIVIIASSLIAIINYFIFLREKKYTHQLEKFIELSLPESKKKRIRTAFVTLFITGFLAIAVSALNNQDFRNWLIQ
jgi:hypothetical protein